MKISTYIFAIILTLLLLVNSTRVSLTYAYYNIDTIGFIESFCINQDKPELKCNGKCHLKKVAQTQDKEQKTPENIIDFKVLIFYTNPLETFVFTKTTYLKKQNAIAYQNLYSFNKTNDCFHPPQV
ncbi:hypothetical protein KO494_12980 [Lacinutrix sp. C3R15]|uniref:hypothetical protein n=1 Tax=Flavobacteriaceae TaxID=49546 RepID=UPI001C08D801|nr:MULTISPECIES: hypothetical protein [Flavobacteriaceae]MBU2940454.1 hypothetical protein [Lacinutrix sp. C3R15]MDO6623774.1 hypothetical protein [Oceanihabitans sp. 1_MG-2023]